jgi:hypothetical protein
LVKGSSEACAAYRHHEPEKPMVQPRTSKICQ